MGRGDSTATSTSLSASPPRFTRHAEGVTVVVLQGEDRGLAVSISDEPITIGTGDASDLVLRDSAVSRAHLRATWRGGALELTDLGSKNGSLLGNERFDTIAVGFGAVFQVGSTVLKVLPEEQVLAPAESASESFGALVGTSPVMRQLFTLIEQVAATDSAVLIEGETGVGKELVAEEIHRRSARLDRPFSVVDCGAVPTELIESTLFGHQRGSFTGATSDRVGIFADANGGTVFLDEVGELDIDLQPALLRVLDRGMIRPVGATGYREVDVRIVAATHQNLGDQITEKRFREDLYYRLAVVRLSVPPLRDRPEDIPLLVRHLLRKLGRADLQLDDEMSHVLHGYEWPGNVRELRNAVERGVALSRGDVLDPTSMIAHTRSRRKRTFVPPPRSAEAPNGPPAPSEARTFREAKAEVIERFEREFLGSLMANHDTLTAAAAAAGMDRKHLRVLLRRHGLVD